MANKKFSEFTLKTDSANVDFVVGYDGSDNVRIAPSNLSSGGASDLNGLSDAKTTSDALYVGTLPTGSSGGGAGNTTLGKNAGVNLNTGSQNVIVGNFAAGQAVNSTRSVAIGQYASFLPTNTYQYVIGIGWAASYNASDNYVIGIGDSTFFSGSGGLGSIAIGSNALRSCTAAGTIALGYQSGYSQTSGSSNTNIGYEAGYSNTTGGFRTMLGYQAGKSQTGGNNTFLGSLSGGSRSGSGSGNTGVGANALRYVENSNNTALGNGAGQYADSTSSNNVMIGKNAMGSAFGSKSNNTAVGYEAGAAITTGSNNVAIGYEALLVQTDGEKNVAIGAGALKVSTSEGRNVAIGFEAMKSMNQLFNPHNTAIGYQADDTNVTGFYRTNIGASTGSDSTGNNITNIGYSAMESSSTVSNEITLGNSSVASLRCAVTSITSLSDQRDKSEIKDLEYGLDFIDSLQPREFVWDNRAETDKDGEEFYSANKGKKDFGFIAQEVQSVDDDTLRLVYDENPDKLELSYGKLVPVLVQAIKELKAEVELLKA
jgi:hypothetical protein